MKSSKAFLKLIFVLAVIAIGMVRCTPEKQFRVLSFFFDGVNDPRKNTEALKETKKDTSLLVAAIAVKPESYLHKPYAENKCTSCHESEFSNRLIKPMPELCYTCHEDFNNKFQTLHGPVASGNCTACHNQHEAKYEKMLEREGRQICLYCHEERQVLKNKVHEKIGTSNCTECHNPHGGDNKGILKKGSCFNCHENFENKYNFIHGPVVSGNCAGCHESHGSQKPKFLSRESQNICLFCHNVDQVFNNPVHKKEKKTNCTVCHNPHGGEDRYILVESIRPYKTKLINKIINPAITDSVSKTNTIKVVGKDSVLKRVILLGKTNENNVVDTIKNKTVTNQAKEKTNIEIKNPNPKSLNNLDSVKITSESKSRIENKNIINDSKVNKANKVDTSKASSESKDKVKPNTLPSIKTETNKKNIKDEGKPGEPSLKNIDSVLKQIKTQIINNKEGASEIAPSKTKDKEHVGYAPDSILQNDKKVNDNIFPLVKPLPPKQ